MARIRSIKPDYWKSESIARLSRDSRLIFIALWSYVDDNGVGLDNERLIAAEIMPLEDDPMDARSLIRACLDELARALRIDRYTVEGKAYFFIRNWDEHQKIDRPNKERYPRPPEAVDAVTSEDVLFDESARDMHESPSTGAVEQRNRGTEEKDKHSSADASLIPPPPAPPDPFNEFWRTYPRSEDRPKALTAWNRHVIKAKINPLMVIAAAQRYRDDPNRDPGFTKHAATWLNNACWENGPLPPRGSPPRQLSTNQRFGATWEANAQAIDQQAAMRQIGA